MAYPQNILDIATIGDIILVRPSPYNEQLDHYNDRLPVDSPRVLMVQTTIEPEVGQQLRTVNVADITDLITAPALFEGAQDYSQRLYLRITSIIDEVAEYRGFGYSLTNYLHEYNEVFHQPYDDALRSISRERCFNEFCQDGFAPRAIIYRRWPDFSEDLSPDVIPRLQSLRGVPSNLSLCPDCHGYGNIIQQERAFGAYLFGIDPTRPQLSAIHQRLSRLRAELGYRPLDRVAFLLSGQAIAIDRPPRDTLEPLPSPILSNIETYLGMPVLSGQVIEVNLPPRHTPTPLPSSTHSGIDNYMGMPVTPVNGILEATIQEPSQPASGSDASSGVAILSRMAAMSLRDQSDPPTPARVPRAVEFSPPASTSKRPVPLAVWLSLQKRTLKHFNAEDLDNRCMICLSQLSECEDEERIVRLTCGHLNHEACIGLWFTRQDTCPQCRSRVIDDN